MKLTETDVLDVKCALSDAIEKLTVDIARAENWMKATRAVLNPDELRTQQAAVVAKRVKRDRYKALDDRFGEIIRKTL